MTRPRASARPPPAPTAREGCGAGATGSAPAPVCGDGIVRGEQCDDAGESATCDANCTVASCGDMTLNVSAGEVCDEGAVQTTTCEANCTAPVCSDNIVNPLVGEQCEPPSTATCDALCMTRPVVCGDGFKAPSEACDDGNLTSGDGCDGLCATESGFACAGDVPSTCTCVGTVEVCGDGVDNDCDGVVDEVVCSSCPCVGLTQGSVTWDVSLNVTVCGENPFQFTGVSPVGIGVATNAQPDLICYVADTGAFVKIITPAEVGICETSVRGIAAAHAVTCP